MQQPRIDSNKQSNRFTCISCRIKFESAELQRDHFKTEWHLYNLKRRVCHLDAIDLDTFQGIQAARPIKEGVAPPQVAHDDDNEEDWETEDEEDEDEMLARVIRADTCLFCDKKSPTAESNVKHMEVHGFFIPEYRYLIDLDGLLEYLGFKVGAGTTCLWCNKQFRTLHGVRLHMIYKDHCKILYDQERALSEFKEFYDYTTQETFELKPPNQICLPASRSVIRRSRPSKVLALSRPTSSRVGPLVVLEKKCIKKFQADRAKIDLRTMMNGNYTLRGRLRQQNPI